MEALSLVIYHKDPGTAQSLEVSLSQHFEPVRLVKKYEELSTVIAKNRAAVLVLDLESSRVDAVRHFHKEFPSLCIVATHRLADDDVWTDAMTQGAADVCEPRKDQVLNSVLREYHHSSAAAA